MECLNDKYFLFHQFCIHHLNVNNEETTPDKYVATNVNRVHIKVMYPGGPSGTINRSLRFKRGITGKTSAFHCIYLKFYISTDNIVYMDYDVTNWINEQFVNLGYIKDFKQKHLKWKLENA